MRPCVITQVTWEESDKRTPMVCFLSQGSDPSPQIEALAKSKEIGEHRGASNEDGVGAGQCLLVLLGATS